jgi:hypothetical protein
MGYVDMTQTEMEEEIMLSPSGYFNSKEFFSYLLEVQNFLTEISDLLWSGTQHKRWGGASTTDHTRETASTSTTQVTRINLQQK